jgi:histone demethylase JARID1
MPKLHEAPVFYPTAEEFLDPMKYIKSISATAKEFGICKIIPPSNEWLRGKPFTKVVNPKDFIFQTKLQNIHQLQHRSGPNALFLEELEKFLEKKGTPLKNIPIIDGQELDLYKLYQAVTSRGGLQQVGSVVLLNNISSIANFLCKIGDTQQKMERDCKRTKTFP